MKLLHLFLLLLCGFTTSVQAQDIDDDMYFVSNKKKAAKSKVKAQQDYANPTVTRRTISAVNDSEANVDYHTGKLRDVDDYNRRNNIISNGQVVAKLQNDTLYVYSNDSTSQQTYVYGSDNGVNSNYYDYDDSYYYNDDYVFTSRLGRYHSVHFIDPWYWDYCYGWYDPWYNPWYGWYAPYYPTWSYSWCSPIYHHNYPIYHHHGGGVSHRPGISKPYYYGGSRPSGTISQVGRTSGGQGNIRSGARTDVNRGSASRLGRQSVTRDGYIPRSERTTTSRSSRSTTSSETSNRSYNQSSRSTDSYRSSSSSSRSSSMGSGSFGGGSRGGNSGGGGFSGGGRGGGGGGVGRGGR